jgi:hypothetical protein
MPDEDPNHFQAGGEIAFGAGKYVLAIRSGVWTSPDLIAWTKATTPVEVDASTGDSLGFDARYIVTVNGKLFGLGQNDMLESDDGVTWTRSDISLVQGNALTFGNGLYVLAGDLGIHTSVDGKSWGDHTPACTTAGAACVSPPQPNLIGAPPGTTFGGPYMNAVFFGGQFYVDHLASTDGAGWAAHGALPPNFSVGGYLFNDSGDDGVIAYGENSPLQAWIPGQTPVTIKVDTSLAAPPLTNGNSPPTVTTALPTSETCATSRCVVLGTSLYLLH